MKSEIRNPKASFLTANPTRTLALVLAVCLAGWSGTAQVPGIISEQGTLLINGTNFEGNCQFKFALVDAGGTRTLWSHDDTSTGGGEPTGPGIELPVVQGVFAVNLGDLTVSNMTQAVPASVFSSSEVYLRVWVNEGANGWQRLAPDRRMTAAGYALAAQTLLGPIQAAQLPGSVAQLNKAQAFSKAIYFLGPIKASNPTNLFVGTFVGDGSRLTNLPASPTSFGLLGNKHAFLEDDQIFTGSNVFSGAVRMTNRYNLLVGAHVGDGAGLTNLNATNLSSTVLDARLSTNVALLNANQTFTGSNTFTGVARLTNTLNLLAGTHVGNGAGLTNLDAANIAGALADARLSTNVALRNADQTFIGSNTFTGVARLTNPTNFLVGCFVGDGSALSNFPAAKLTGTAASATNFTGSLAGDVSGSQGATVVGTVGGLSAGGVVAGAKAANAATSDSMPGALVKRDAAGGFQAATITGAFVGDGGGLTGLNADQLTAGTVADGRLSTNVVLLNADQTFTGSNTFTGVARLINPTNVLVGYFVGDGSALSNVPAAKLTGTAPSATNFAGSLAGDVSGSQGATVVATVGDLSAGGVAAGAKAANAATSDSMPGALVKRDAAGGFRAATVTGAFVGDGGGLTGLNATQLTAGTVADGRLSANVALLNANQTLTGENHFDGVSRLTNPNNLLVGSHVGDGSGLTNINAANITGGGQISLPSGITVVSMLANDATLIANGYRRLMTVPAPAWVNGSSGGEPSGRFGHTAVWDGQRLIVWGGRLTAGSSYLSSGALYSPDADQWQALSTINSPGARWGHTAVWTGHEMLVWGGNSSTGCLNSGGGFQPGQQLWRAIPTTGAPVARSDHAAVWTGNQMFIYGGQNDSGLLNDGALYDPVSNQWSTVNGVNAPEPRMGATAVWAADRVLIWGGEGTAGEVNSGAQLGGAQLRDSNGAPAQWVAMTSENAPAGRRGHSTVWTGERMIVWGGQSGGVPLGDGAAYDPVSDSWTPLPTTGAPAPRFNHAAVWTGQEMLILGGSSGTAEFVSGAAYDPSTELWRPLSASGNPRARTEASAAWTGTEVIVFGGRAQGQAVGSLQRLIPQPVWYFYRKL